MTFLVSLWGSCLYNRPLDFDSALELKHDMFFGVYRHCFYHRIPKSGIKIRNQALLLFQFIKECRNHIFPRISVCNFRFRFIKLIFRLCISVRELLIFFGINLWVNRYVSVFVHTTSILFSL